MAAKGNILESDCEWKGDGGRKVVRVRSKANSKVSHELLCESEIESEF